MKSGTSARDVGNFVSGLDGYNIRSYLLLCNKHKMQTRKCIHPLRLPCLTYNFETRKYPRVVTYMLVFDNGCMVCGETSAFWSQRWTADVPQDRARGREADQMRICTQVPL